ncbi:MAG: hypothetical protein NUV46_02115 [Nanoarchaeota archaeon]|nr:hypothetical protein [Nanoarchaeota archaeon]
MFKKTNKKGELTTQQIVLLIILIVSFAVILFFIIRLNLNQETEQEVCHNSVVLRGSSVVSSDAVPLKCQRQYMCLSYDGSCEEMTNPKVVKVRTENEVYKSLAEEMATCWWIFGEGKINYVGSDVVPELYCSICSQISFDDSVKEKVFQGSNEFDKKKFYEYMANERRSDGRTYLSYLGLDGLEKHSGDFGKVNMENQYYSLMGITSDVSTLGWIGIGAGTAAALVLSPFTGPAVTIVSVVGLLTVGAGATAGALVAPVIEGSSGQQFIPPSLIEVNSQEFKDLKCETITTAS